MEERDCPMTIRCIADPKDIYRYTELSGELWLPVRGTGSLYYVSDMGRILTTNYYGHGKLALMKPYQTGKSASKGCGYLQVKLYVNGAKRAMKVHRIVAEHFIPNPSDLPQVNHINGNQLDNRASNLEWTTNTENKRWSSKLSMEIAGTIRASWLSSHDISKESFCRSEAKRYGVTRNCIRFILNGTTWS